MRTSWSTLNARNADFHETSDFRTDVEMSLETFKGSICIISWFLTKNWKRQTAIKLKIILSIKRFSNLLKLCAIYFFISKCIQKNYQLLVLKQFLTNGYSTHINNLSWCIKFCYLYVHCYVELCYLKLFVMLIKL